MFAATRRDGSSRGMVIFGCALALLTVGLTVGLWPRECLTSISVPGAPSGGELPDLPAPQTTCETFIGLDWNAADVGRRTLIILDVVVAAGVLVIMLMRTKRRRQP